MEQRSSDAALKDAQHLLRREECAEGMEQRSRSTHAAVRDVLMVSSKEECALDMGQRGRHAAVKNAQIKLR